MRSSASITGSRPQLKENWNSNQSHPLNGRALAQRSLLVEIEKAQHIQLKMDWFLLFMDVDGHTFLLFLPNEIHYIVFIGKIVLSYSGSQFLWLCLLGATHPIRGLGPELLVLCKKHQIFWLLCRGTVLLWSACSVRAFLLCNFCII